MSKRMIDSELIEALGTDIKFDENGNVIVSKNLEVGGTTKLMNGLEPIHTYNLDGVTTLYVYFEYAKYGTFIGYGWIINTGTPRPCIFHYALQDGNVIRFRGLSDDIIYEYNSNSSLTQTFTIAKKSECQPKLYRHMLSLSAASSADGTCRLEWISSNNLECKSLQDLRTLLNNPQMSSYVASNPSGDLFCVVISPSTAQFKKAGTDSLANINNVLDTVTPL